MKIGYARVSTTDQDLTLQLEALERDGCERIYADKMSGTKKHRPEFDKALEQLRTGDTLVVWKFDRLGRSLVNMVELLDSLHKQGIHIRSLTDSVDTSTTSGKMFAQLLAILAEYERAVTLERTQAGLAVAKAKGKLGGRPRVVGDEKETMILALRAAGKSADAICKAVQISKPTYYRWLRERNEIGGE